MEVEKISILMPVFNGELFLRQSIESIICQTYSNWELILIDDGSTDTSESIILKFTDERIKHFKNETNLGLIKTLNKGIDLCNGEFIARMDADDISLPDRLEKQYNYMRNNSEIAMVGTNAFLIDKKNNITGKIINLTTNSLLKINLLFSVPFIHPSIMIRSYILKDLKYDENYKYAEDYDLWCRVSSCFNIANLSDFLLKYRWHESNVSVLNNEKQHIVKNQIIEKQLENNLDIKPSIEELHLHKVTFIQYDVKGNYTDIDFKDYTKLNSWFTKLIDANRKHKFYQQNDFTAYLWSRWIVLCIKQKKYFNIFQQNFVPFNLKIYSQTIAIVYNLSKKK